MTDTEFLKDLAMRIHQNATPAMGFDQGDVDQLLHIAKHRSTSTEEAERLREALEKIQSNDQIPRHKVYRVPPSEETVDGPYARIARTALTGASNHVG